MTFDFWIYPAYHTYVLRVGRSVGLLGLAVVSGSVFIAVVITSWSRVDLYWDKCTVLITLFVFTRREKRGSFNESL